LGGESKTGGALIGLETATGLFFTALLLALVPGPDNLFVLTQSVLLGRWAGLMATLGFCTGLIVHTLGVALGVAALLQQSDLAFTLLKLGGAGYLFYLAWRFLRATAIDTGQAETTAPRPWMLYRRGIIMNVTNPKVSLFFLAFLPQFIDPKIDSVVVQLIAFGGLFMLATLLVFGAVALLADTLRPWLNRKPQAQRLIQRVAACVFVGLAIKLLMTSPV
jgi:threonine/homoserine/homoserine lactone efflux protein